MPFYRRYRTRRPATRRYATRSRRYGAKRRFKPLPRNNLIVSPTRYFSPIGQAQQCTLRYVENITLGIPGINGAITDYVFNTMSCFDPNTSGAGHQPRGFDQMMALFDRYQVLASKITIRGSQNSMTSAYFLGITTAAASSTLSGTTATEQVEAPLTVSRLVGGSGNNSWQPAVYLNHTFVANKWFMVPRSAMIGDPSFQGTAASSPGTTAFWHVWYGDGNGGVPSSVCDLNVVIEYRVLFTNPIPVGPS